jgi:hypothetical protein
MNHSFALPAHFIGRPEKQPARPCSPSRQTRSVRLTLQKNIASHQIVKVIPVIFSARRVAFALITASELAMMNLQAVVT